MNIKILRLIIIAMSLSAAIVIVKETQQQEMDILPIGTFIVLLFTLIVLMFYANDTHRIAIVTEKEWLSKTGVFMAGYKMLPDLNAVHIGATKFCISNPSTIFIRARVICEFRVNGILVNCTPPFNGQENWLVFPQQTNEGYYNISDLVAQQGLSIEQMQESYTDENRTTQLTLDLTIEFRDESGNRRNLPTRRHYFAFNIMRWVPVITTVEGWEN